MKRIIYLCVTAMLLSGCAGWNNYWANVRQNQANNPSYYQQQPVTYQQPTSQPNLRTNPQYYHPDMDCRTYPPGYPFPVEGGSIRYPQQNGEVIVCYPKGGDVYNQQGTKVGTYKPR